MRIIAGSARGREISAPKGLETRPVTDIIRESLFHIWQFDVEAGSDQVRGIRANLKKTGLDKCHAEVVRDDVFRVIGHLGRTHQTFDIVYLDPPFTVDEIFIPVMEALADGALRAEGGTVAIRTRDRKEMPDDFGVLHKVRLKRYGSSAVHFYERVDEESQGEPETASEDAQGDGDPAAQERSQDA